MTTPTTQQAAFLQAICESPHDDAPRLMYADWLEERGDPRGEFIHVQLTLAKKNQPEVYFAIDRRAVYDAAYAEIDRQINIKRLQRREQELIAAWGSYTPWIVPHPDIVLDDYKFHRGFVELVACTMQTWLDHGPALVRAAPLLEVRLTDREPWSVDARYPDGYSWFRETDVAARIAQGDADNDWVPDEWFNLLWGRPWGSMLCAKTYNTAELAHADLSRVCLAWAREQAGLRS